jgi:hypothetical protein
MGMHKVQYITSVCPAQPINDALTTSHTSTTAAEDKATKKRPKVDSSTANRRVEHEGHASEDGVPVDSDNRPTRFHAGSEDGVSVHPEPSEDGVSVGGSPVHTTTNTDAVADTMKDAANKEETYTLTSNCMVLRPSLVNFHNSPPHIHAEFPIITQLFVDRPVNSGDYGDGNVLEFVLKLSASNDLGGTNLVGRNEAEAFNFEVARTLQVYI